MPFPIAYIAGQFPKRSETFVYREVRALRERGWPVHTFTLHAPDEETPAELREMRETTGVVYAGSGAKRLLAHTVAAIGAAIDVVSPGGPIRERVKLVAQAAAGAALATKLKSLGVRHVHAHFAHAPASVAMYAARAAGISFSFTGHANDLFQRRQALALKLQRAAFVSCISEWHRELYQSIVPGDATKYPVVRCGVDTSELAPTPHEVAVKPRVLTVCRLVEKKGVDTLLRAAAILKSRGRPIEVIVAGDGPMRSQLESIASGLDVKFLGPLDARQVRDELARADAFALPCRVDSNGDRDGIPVVLMEAMACGLPVVSGDLPAIRELVRDRQTGLLVPGGDDTATADAIASAIDRRSLLGSTARQWIVDAFSLRGTVEQLEASFSRAVTV